MWDLDNPHHHMVRTRDNLATPRGVREWLALTPGQMWLGRTVLVNHPSMATTPHAVLLSVGVGDLITLVGAPFWMWRTNDLLEGSFAVPATTYRPGIALEDDALPRPGLVQVSHLLPPISTDPNNGLTADALATLEMNK